MSLASEDSVQQQLQVKQYHAQQPSVARRARDDAVEPVEAAFGEIRRRFAVVARYDVERAARIGGRLSGARVPPTGPCGQTRRVS